VARNSPLTPEGNAAFLASYGARSDVQKLPGGTMYRVLFKGTGKQTPLGRADTVTVSYRGWLIDGTSFDSSPVGSPRTFQINALIPGWRDALLKMKEGDLWEIVVPADQAYGAEGRAGRIPPNQTLIFVVSLAHVAYAG
jgi:FKBP-type peptidyl-prolyl cis-trans isomerase FklB